MGRIKKEPRLKEYRNDGEKYNNDSKIIHSYENENIMLSNNVIELKKFLETKRRRIKVRE